MTSRTHNFVRFQVKKKHKHTTAIKISVISDSKFKKKLGKMNVEHIGDHGLMEKIDVNKVFLKHKKYLHFLVITQKPSSFQ